MAKTPTKPALSILFFSQLLGCDPADADCEDGGDHTQGSANTAAGPEPAAPTFALPSDGCLSDMCVADADVIRLGMQPKCRFEGSDGEPIPPCIGGTAGVVPVGSTACWYSFETEFPEECIAFDTNVQVHIATEAFDADGMTPGIRYECVASDDESIDCPH